AAVHEAGIEPPAFVGADVEPLLHAGPERIDEPVGPAGEAPHDLLPLGLLEVHADRSAAPPVHVVLPLDEASGHRFSRPVDADDVRAHVAQHHRAHGPGADARQLDDGEAVQWSHRGPPGVVLMWWRPAARERAAAGPWFSER